MAELTANGLVVTTLLEYKANLEEAFRDAFGQNIDLDPQSVNGQLIAILSERFALIDEAMQAVYSAFDPDKAEGQALRALCALTGTTPLEATASTVALTLTGDPGTVLTSGKQASVSDTGSVFQTLANVTLVGATAWAPSTAYTINTIRTNASKVYLCTGGGTSAGSGGPTTEADVITDGSVTWRFLGDGTAYGNVQAECTQTGPITALSGTVTVIETPISGWLSVINILDADLGRNVETDIELRLHRELDLRAASAGTVESIRAALLSVESVTTCTVFQNTGDVTDGDGIPPHAVEALVQGGDDDTIRDTLWKQVAAGIATHGTVSGTVTDSQGISHTVKFSRPTLRPVYVIIHITVDSSTYPSDGDAQVEDAIVAWGDARPPGYDTVSSAISAQAFKVPGVLDVTATYIGLAPAPASSVTIAHNVRQLGTYDTSRITVIATPGTP